MWCVNVESNKQAKMSKLSVFWEISKESYDKYSYWSSLKGTFDTGNQKDYFWFVTDEVDDDHDKLWTVDYNGSKYVYFVDIYDKKYFKQVLDTLNNHIKEKFINVDCGGNGQIVIFQTDLLYSQEHYDDIENDLFITTLIQIK